MSKYFLAAFTLGALIAGAALARADSLASAGPAAAAGAAPADAVSAAVARPRRKMSPTIVVAVTNRRAVPLAELDATPAGGAGARQIVANLAPGAKTSVRLARGKSCLFDLHGAFDDGASTTIASINLCRDNTVNLVE